MAQRTETVVTITHSPRLSRCHPAGVRCLLPAARASSETEAAGPRRAVDGVDDASG